MERHVLSVLVKNSSGVLTRVSGLFARRGFNIDSLTVGSTENPNISRMTITLNGNEDVLEQFTKQLNKLEDVLRVLQLKPDELAKNLQNNGGFIPGVRPGKDTEKHIGSILSKLTIVGGLFLVIISGLPIVFSGVSGLPATVTIGGTSLLIVVGVALETYKQLEGSLVTRTYKKGYSRR